MRGILLAGMVVGLIAGNFAVGLVAADGELYCEEGQWSCCIANEPFGLNRTLCESCVTPDPDYIKRWEYSPGHQCHITAG